MGTDAVVPDAGLVRTGELTNVTSLAIDVKATCLREAST
jgi:hypothetical protein